MNVACLRRPRCVRLAVALLLLVPAAASAQTGPELFFSEYVEGSSNNKALEIFNPAGAPVDLAEGGYSVQMFFNGSVNAGLTIDLSGVVAPGGVYVLAHASAAAEILAVADQTNGAGWFNGDDAVVLRKGTAVIDSIGQIGFDPGTEWGSGLTSTADNTLRRRNTVVSGDSVANDAFDPAAEWDGFATNTFDGLGGGIVLPPQLTTIHEIQGSGLASPLAGQRVKVLGVIVTAVGPDGFFIQTPPERVDGDPSTSEGVFVFTGSAAPAVRAGDLVDVAGSVAEFFNLTELNSPTATILSSGHPIPSAEVLDEMMPSATGSPTQLERLEGMLVRLVGGTASGPTDRFGDTPVVAGSTRPFREPGIVAPGVVGLPVWDGNPEIFEINADQLGLPRAQIPAGSRIELAEGPLGFDFGDYQIWPTKLEYTPARVLRPVRARAPGEFTVASQNVLRLFDDIDDVDVDDEVVSVPALELRLEKLSAHVRLALNAPDILAVQEVEKLSVLHMLAARIAADDSSLQYSAYLLEGNDVGGIDVGFLVRETIRVDSIEQFGKDDVFAFDGSLLNDRPPLVLRGAYVGNGAPFPIVVVNVHQRSLSGIEGSSAGAQRVRQKRFDQAVRLAELIQSLQVEDPNIRLAIVGDFNAFEFTDGYVDVMGIVTGELDPRGALLSGIYIVQPGVANRTFDMPESERYSFVFDGSAQSLDHALTSTALDPWVRDAEHARGNADAPALFAGDPTTPLRAADHDATVLFVMGDFDGDGLADDVDYCPQGPNDADFDHDGIPDACDPSTGPPVDKEQCKNDDWRRFDTPAFRNQGLCVAHVESRRP